MLHQEKPTTKHQKKNKSECVLTRRTVRPMTLSYLFINSICTFHCVFTIPRSNLINMFLSYVLSNNYMKARMGFMYVNALGCFNKKSWNQVDPEMTN